MSRRFSLVTLIDDVFITCVISESLPTQKLNEYRFNEGIKKQTRVNLLDRSLIIDWRKKHVTLEREIMERGPPSSLCCYKTQYLNIFTKMPIAIIHLGIYLVSIKYIFFKVFVNCDDYSWAIYSFLNFGDCWYKTRRSNYRFSPTTRVHRVKNVFGDYWYSIRGLIFPARPIWILSSVLGILLLRLPTVLAVDHV